MKVVINTCYGGFELSQKALELYSRLKGSSEPINDYYIERNDPILIKVVETLGDKANGSTAELAIVEIPDDINWEIEQYDGVEWVSEAHRRWGGDDYIERD